MMRSFVIRRLNGPWGSFVNNLHFHISPVSFELVLTGSIEVNFFSDILEEAFGSRCVHIQVTKMLDIQDQLTVMMEISLDLDWRIVEVQLEILVEL